MPPDPDAIAAAAEACPSVARLSSGAVEQVATYLPGRRVLGVRVSGEEIAVHVVARWGPSLPAVGDEVRAAVRALAGDLPVSVSIDDVETPRESAPQQLGSG